jgi:HPt (histidine-containing phosphotransfer) domain-containing protein
MFYERRGMMASVIDKKGALDKLGGSTELYYKLLTGFMRQYESIDKTIGELAAQKDYEEARRLAHSIKGLSGNLVSLALQKSAKALEGDLKNRSESYHEKLEDFSEIHKKVVMEVERLVTELENGQN